MPQKQSQKPKDSSTPKRVFIYILMIAMLYISVIAILTLYFQYINYTFFDSTQDYRTGIFQSIRWASAILIVAFPVLVYTTSLINKEIKSDPKLRDIRMRKWLLYFTQFITSITIIIDLMVLIYRFYGGELTVRFGLKVGVVLIIAAIVLGYYRWELKRKEDGKHHISQIMATTTGMLLLISLVAGFFIAGSPSEQRAIRLDEQRVNDLSQIQNSVVNFAQTKATLPENMDALKTFAGTLPKDPETHNDYTYTKSSETVFELCSTFASKQEDQNTKFGYTPYADPAEVEKVNLVSNTSWAHEAGYVCFDSEVSIQSK